MRKQALTIGSIPAVLWGDPSDALFIAVHGNLSNKEDAVIALFAEAAVAKGYQVLSFDLPGHGDRKKDAACCNVQDCVQDLALILQHAQSLAKQLRLFACSMGAYFSLLAYRDTELAQCLFLSPVVNMERIILNMLTWFEISEERLEAEKEIATPIGETLSWDYYRYVKEHPIVTWNKPTALLYGSADTLCEFSFVTAFARRFGCELTVLENGEHYFHSAEQLDFFRHWLQKKLPLAAVISV
ncbi:alpha/beta hydrolase [Azotosporobacter soli]|uniref:alpha/beta hydrolase n=1 Tax=Azotosporobacter soli TaxID=3055040 RepID=UPI0031FE7546